MKVYPKKMITGSNCSVLNYEKRKNIWALRGLSPGTQKVFTLTEGERIHNGLGMNDVTYCVTSLREIPKELEALDEKSFRKHYIDANKKCWLIRSDKSNKHLSKSLMDFISNIPEAVRNTSTCRNRDIWYAFAPHPVSTILYSSGFTHYGPKFLINKIGVIAVGSVHGIHSETDISINDLVRYLRNMNFQKRVVAHAGALKKIEVRQMNSVLNKYHD